VHCCKINVSHGEIKMDRIMRRRELPCVRRSKSFYKSRVVRGAEVMLMEKSDEETKKKHRNRLTDKGNM
jgi:hypothetical protein